MLVASFAMLLACGQPDAPLRTEVGQQAIVGGIAAPDETAIVLIVYDDDTTSFCSAVVIAPNLLMTARHCVTDVGSGIRTSCAGAITTSSPPYFDEMRPFRIGVVTDGAALANARVKPATHGRRVFHPASNDRCSPDVALVELEAPLSVPAVRLELATRPNVGQSVSVVGYGSANGRSVTPPTRRKRDVTVRAYPASGIGTATTGVCDGDSGGGILAADGALVGITFAGVAEASNCNGDTGFVPLPDVADLVRFALQETGNAADTPAAAPEGAAPPQPAPPSDDGSGCSLAPPNEPRGSLALLALAALFGLARRRRDACAAIATCSVASGLLVAACSASDKAEPTGVVDAGPDGAPAPGRPDGSLVADVYVSGAVGDKCTPINVPMDVFPASRPLVRSPGACSAADIAAFAKACASFAVPWNDACFTFVEGHTDCAACTHAAAFGAAWGPIINVSWQVWVPNVGAALLRKGVSASCAAATTRETVCANAACTCGGQASPQTECQGEALKTTCKTLVGETAAACTNVEEATTVIVKRNWAAELAELATAACGAEVDGGAADAAPTDAGGQ